MRIAWYVARQVCMDDGWTGWTGLANERLIREMVRASSRRLLRDQDRIDSGDKGVDSRLQWKVRRSFDGIALAGFMGD